MKCVRCQKIINELFRPFCSKRCQQIDLGHWLKGDYVVSHNSSDRIYGALDILQKNINED